MKADIDVFQGHIARSFRELILAMSYLKIGGQTLAKANENDHVDVLLDEDIRSEPFKVAELMPHTADVELGILDLYQTNMVTAWMDLLAALFAHFVRRHFDGVHQYKELKRRDARIDFTDSANLRTQVEQTLISEFTFEAYADRVRTVNVILNPAGKHADLLDVIKTHVHVRNAVQHHSGKVFPRMLKELGTTNVSLLNAEAKSVTFTLNDRLLVSVPEIDRLKRALFRLSNEWRLHA